MSEARTCECSYKWVHGKHAEHNCSVYYKLQIKQLIEEREKYKKTEEEIIYETATVILNQLVSMEILEKNSITYNNILLAAEMQLKGDDGE